jgi:rare lipoprotein A
MRENVFMHSRALFIGLLTLSALLSSACGGSRAAHVKTSAASIRIPVGVSEEGLASWYGDPYHGRRAANGEVYDMEQMTAAHRTLPFETWVRVINSSNRKSTEVRITDRGPFIEKRIIDLSKAAAREIELLGPGVTKVKITVIAPPKSYTRGRQFTVQVSTSRDRAKAEQLRTHLGKEYRDVIVKHRSNPEVWRVLVGNEPKIENAQQLALKLQGQFPNCFVIRSDVE